MRFLFVHPFLSDFGGAQLALVWLSKGLVEKGHGVKICVGQNTAKPARLSAYGIEVKVLDPSDSGRLIREAQEADVIIAGNYPATHWIGDLSQSALPPVVWNCNEPPRVLYEGVMSPHFLASQVDPKFYFPWTRRLKEKRLAPLIEKDRRIVKSFCSVVAISRQTASWVNRIYGFSCDVVPLAIGDMQLEARQWPADPFIVFSPAGLEPIKNFKTVLEAFARLLKKDRPPKSRLWMSGEGFWRSHAEKTARKLGIFENVEFLGSLPREEMIQCYARCHAVVYVPLDEPFGLVSCEAGMAGKPVVASNHGGPAETVAHGENGLLVDPLDAQQIADALYFLDSDRVYAKKMGEAGQNKMSGEFGYETFIAGFKRAVDRAVQSAPRRQEFLEFK